MATSSRESVLKTNLRRCGKLEADHAELKQLLGFERAVNKTHEEAALKASKETEKLRKIISEIDGLHEPCHESMHYCGECGEEFPYVTRLIIDGKES